MDRLFVSYQDAMMNWALAFPEGCGDFFKQQSPITIPPIRELEMNQDSESERCLSNSPSTLESLSTILGFSRNRVNGGYSGKSLRANSKRNDVPTLVCSDENPCDELTFYETIGLHDKYVSGYNEYSMIGLDLDALNTRHPTLTNGPRGLDYELVNIHFHLGPAEHPIEGTNLKIDATIHAVHYNQDVNMYAVVEHQLHFDSESDLDLELKCSDVCKCCGKNMDQCELRGILPREDMNFCSLKEGEVLKRENFNQIETKKESWVKWLDIESNDLSGYVTYNGGLTTPPCDQDVTFYINPNPIKVQPFEDCYRLNKALNAVDKINGGNSRPPTPILYGTKIQIV